MALPSSSTCSTFSSLWGLGRSRGRVGQGGGRTGPRAVGLRLQAGDGDKLYPPSTESLAGPMRPPHGANVVSRGPPAP